MKQVPAAICVLELEALSSTLHHLTLQHYDGQHAFNLIYSSLSLCVCIDVHTWVCVCHVEDNVSPERFQPYN